MKACRLSVVLVGALLAGAAGTAWAEAFADDASGITLHAPGWRLAARATTPEAAERLRLEFGGPEAPESFVALTLGRAPVAAGTTLEACRDQVLAGLPREWRREEAADVPVGTARLPGLRARFALREGGLAWTTDLFFFKSETALFSLQTMALTAGLAAAEARYLAVVAGAEIAWAAAGAAVPAPAPAAAPTAAEESPVGTWALFTPGGWGAWRAGGGSGGAAGRRDPREAADAGFVQVGRDGRWLAHGCGKWTGRWEEDEGTPVLRAWAGEDWWFYPDGRMAPAWLFRTARGAWLYGVRLADDRLVRQEATTPAAAFVGTWRLARAEGPAAAGELTLAADGAYRLTLDGAPRAGRWQPSGDPRIDGLALAGADVADGAEAGGVEGAVEGVVTLDSRDNRRIVVRVREVEYRGERGAGK